MAKKSEQNNFFDQAKTWWETDTAKAIATIVAVLLIPASVIAWNYATNRAEDNGAELAQMNEREEQESSENDENGENEEATEETTETEASTGTNEQSEGQEPSEPNGIGGIESVQELPDTTSDNLYTVQRGDNVYSISINVCGNESYYKSNMRKRYLRVGEVIDVSCTY